MPSIPIERVETTYTNSKKYIPLTEFDPVKFDMSRFNNQVKISQKTIDDLNKSIQDLTKAFELLSAQFQHIFDGHVLINGKFVDIKNIKGEQK